MFVFAYLLLFSLGLLGQSADSLTGYDTFPPAGKGRTLGLKPTRCWFDKTSSMPPTECFNMHVPEDHTKPAGRTITFPVVVFRATQRSEKSPVLHLGAGGPGSALYLHSTDSVSWLLDTHDDLSIEQGRDLIFIDPRGAGEAVPRLSCLHYILQQEARLEADISLAEEADESDKDFMRCLNAFSSRGIGLKHYNSRSVASDVEMLRKYAKVERWSLIGVSHAATYAQLIAMEFPDSVDTLILDSPTFPSVRAHHSFADTLMNQYNAIYGHCGISDSCSDTMHTTSKRIWSLQSNLNSQPITVSIPHPFKDDVIDVVLNGDRFIITMLNNIYFKDFFHDLPTVLGDLEDNNGESIKPYLENYVFFLLDENFSDISMTTHFCNEERLFDDQTLLKSLSQDLPEGFIRDSTLLGTNWSDECEHIGVHPPLEQSGEPVVLPVRTLFLQGRWDMVTALKTTREQMPNFPNSRLEVYGTTHGILGVVACAEQSVAHFLDSRHVARPSNCADGS